MQPSGGNGDRGAGSGDHEAWGRGLLALEQRVPPRTPTRRERRIARWTRPAPKRDLRWAIGRFGQILIVVGLLMFGFVGYQLWGTGIEYARAQNEATDVVEQLMAEARQRAGLDSAPDAGARANTIELDTAVLDPLTVPDTASDDVTGTLAGDPSGTAEREGAATTTGDLPGTTSGSGVTAADRDRLATFEWSDVIEDEQWFAYLSIPRLDRTDKIIEGVEPAALKKGPGHFPTTPLPGQLGNSALAGHRTSFGAPFLELDQLEIGDEIILETPYGGPDNGPGRFVYVVTGTEVVRPSDVRVIATVDPEIATLTLITCHPAYSTRERLVIYAELDLEQSDAPGPAVIPADLPQIGLLPGDDSLATAAVDDAANTSTGTSDPTTVSDPAATTDPTGVSVPTATTDPASVATSTAVGDDGASDDASDELDELIGGGWFEDTDAWPEVAAWGGLTALVALLAYGLAKLTRFGLIGLAFGIAPFLVTLYFTYQNINRLLPAAF